MLTHSNSLKIALATLVFFVGFFTFAVGAVRAASVFDIEFPVSELGGCADRFACKAFCSEAKNENACSAFAEKYGLQKSSVSADSKFKQIEEDGGPGGCAAGAANPGLSCRTYCDNTANIEQCVNYAREHNLLDERELGEADKVLSALKRGISLPPQCTNAASCKATCENPADVATARACFAFGKEAGLLPPGVDDAQAEKVFSSIERGTGPFKSFAEMRQCENPPNDAVLQKCIAFGEEAGFISPHDADIIKKTGGRGPGGCAGREQCETYCRAHGEECFRFGEEHNLIREEDRQRMREGLSGIQRALNEAPPEIVQCIKNAVPDLDRALTNRSFIGPEIGEKMRRCFESQFGRQGEHRDEFESRQGLPPPGGRFESNIPQLPPEALHCIEGKLGRPFAEVVQQGSPTNEVEQVIRACMNALKTNETGEHAFPQNRMEPLERSGQFQRAPTPEELEKYRQYQEQGGGTRVPEGTFTQPPSDFQTAPHISPDQREFTPEEHQKYQEYLKREGTAPSPTDVPPPATTETAPTSSGPSGFLARLGANVNAFTANVLNAFFGR